jgi:hypothetical protein
MTVGAPPHAPALLLALSFGVAACGGNDAGTLSRDTAAIYGGARVTDGRFENVVALATCTGILVAPSVVVYAAHCGTSFHEALFGSDVVAPERRASLARCSAHPDAALGNGRDVAFCELSEPVLDVPPLELLDDAQAADVVAGAEVREVGYGLESDEGAFGTKREGSGTIVTLGDDVVIRGTDSGTCSGDSGGPALVRVDADANGEDTFRALGILSAGTSFDCGPSTDHYTNLRSVRPWLETETGTELGVSVAAVARRADAEPAPACQSSSGRRRGSSSVGGFVVVALALLRRARFRFS